MTVVAQRRSTRGKPVIVRGALKRLFRDESGATAIEYGLIAAGVSVAIITVVNTLGLQLKSTFTTISSPGAIGVAAAAKPIRRARRDGGNIGRSPSRITGRG
jgi:pilus assembly protein Flp/PilA